MVRFSCFPSPIYHKSKKSSPELTETIKADSGTIIEDPTTKNSSCSLSSNLRPKVERTISSETSIEQSISPTSFDCCWKSEEMTRELIPDNKGEIPLKGLHRKSQSLGSVFEREISDLEKDIKTMFVNSSHSLNVDMAKQIPLFSSGGRSQSDGEANEDGDKLPNGSAADSVSQTTHDLPPTFAKSFSFPNLRVCVQEDSPVHGFELNNSKSFEDLSATSEWEQNQLGNEDMLSLKATSGNHNSASSCHDISQASHAFEREDCVFWNRSGGSFQILDQELDNNFGARKRDDDSHLVDGYTSLSFPLLADQTPNAIEEGQEGNTLQPETAILRQNDLSPKEYNFKRIQDWLSKMEPEATMVVPESGESSNSASKSNSHVISSEIVAKAASRSSPGVEAANNYISSLTPISSSAQLANLGLIAIPFLGAFVSLRVLNLSGNAIVRITAGALPRGLHALNLSRNNISTIEGLRELARLRVLDLSYNRICRIGHGLAACSSLKELYLAGNKISEVEGLHRLLKLSILDLRFNKISTAKCLGQLAANYNSLQAINLEGNPAQRNVGDDQLKKCLQGLLPQLVYFNKQTLRNSSSKEVSDRPARSIKGYQYDRGHKVEHKLARRGNHGGSTRRSVASSAHGRSHQGAVSPKRAKSRHGHHLPGGSRASRHETNKESSPISLQPGNPMRRSHSEGTLLAS